MDSKASPSASANFPLRPIVAGLLAIAIFAVDTLSRLPDAVAVLYVLVLLLSANFLTRRGLLLVAVACGCLAILGYLLSHTLWVAGDSLVRLLVSLAAIGTTAFLAMKNQAAVAELQEQARLLDLTHDTIFVRDMKDIITYWNHGAEVLYGRSSGEALGKTSHQFLQTVFPAPFDNIQRELLRTGHWEGELVHTKADGAPVTVASRWSLQRDERQRPIAVLETNNDITEHKRAEETLRRQASLLEQTYDAILVWESPGMIVYWNRGAEQLYGFSREEAVGCLSHDLLQTELPMPPKLFENLIEREGTWTGELTHTTRDGRKVIVDSRQVLVREESGRRFVLETNHDITQRKKTEEKLQRAQSDLAHVTRVTTLGEFAASIAHEVNQPLAAIVTNGEVCLRLFDHDVPDLVDARGAVEAIINNGRRASEIIQRLRALSAKTETQKMTLDINETVKEVVPLVQQEALSRRVSLQLELAQTLPKVLGDRVQLQQVIINLVVNGMEAMAPVTDRRPELIIRSRRNDAGQVLIAVQDNGVGIDPEIAKRLFETFFTTKSGGMGMGLPICRTIIENHGGTLWASANAGPGTTFQFTLASLPEARP